MKSLNYILVVLLTLTGCSNVLKTDTDETSVSDTNIFKNKVVSTLKFTKKKQLQVKAHSFDINYSPKNNYFSYRSRESYYITDNKIKNKILWKYDKNDNPFYFIGQLSDFTADENYFVFSHYKKINDIAVLNLSNKEIIQVFEGNNKDVGVISISNKTNYLASGGGDGIIRLWKFSNNKYKQLQTLTGHSVRVESLAFSPNDQYMASGSEDGTIIIWEFSNGAYKKKQTLLAHTKNTKSLSFNNDGSYLISGSYDGTIKIWEWKNSKFVIMQTLQSGPIYSVTFSPNANYFAAGTGYKGHVGNGSIKVWSLINNKFKQLLDTKADSMRVHSVGFSPDGSFLASGHYERAVKIWKLEN